MFRSVSRLWLVALLAVVPLTLLVSSCSSSPTTTQERPKESEPPRSFQECAEQVGITFRMVFLEGEQGKNFKTNLYDHGSGLAVGDYDGDGHDDIYFCNQLGKNALYHNKGDGTFEDVTDKAGVGLGDRVCVAATWANTRNSERGLQDLYVTSTRGGNVLFRNNGDGTFKDVTKEAGLALDKPTHSQTAVFFDYDNDGFLDLFVTNSAEWTLHERDKSGRYFTGVDGFADLAKSPREHNVLYHNNRDGTFTKVENSGLEGNGWGGDVAVFDYDSDGRLDVVVTSMFGASRLYRNEGNGKFTDVTKTVLGQTSWGGIGARAFDFNNDGRLDLLITDMHSDMWFNEQWDPRKTNDNLRKKYKHVVGPNYESVPGSVEQEEGYAKDFDIHYDEVVFGNTLFKNLGDGKFVEVSDDAGMETFWPWGSAIGDFDNDGFEDVFLPSGMSYPYYYWPNALMMNNGNGTFTDRAKELGIEPRPDGEYGEEIGGRPGARSSRCAAAADFTGKGRLDLVVNNFNGRAYFFRNHFSKKNYVAFRLTGTQCNRDAIGALVKVHMGDEVMVRQVQAAGGYLTQSSKTVHFGLGDHQKIDRVEIRWPGTDKPQTIENPAINQLHAIEQPKR